MFKEAKDEISSDPPCFGTKNFFHGFNNKKSATLANKIEKPQTTKNGYLIRS